jgi:predicted RNA-binding protein
MQFNQLKKNEYWRVQLKPATCYLDEDGQKLPLVAEDYWTIEEVLKDGVRISNVRSDQKVILGFDHIHHFSPDPNRSGNGIKYGFLVLHVQVFQQRQVMGNHSHGNKVWVEPNARPGEPVEPPIRLRSGLT